MSNVFGIQLKGRRFLVALAVTASLITALSAANAQDAAAGTYIKGKTCSLYQYSSCYLGYTYSVQFQCYSRFSVTSPSPYPLHSASITTYPQPGNGTLTTAQHAYSPIGMCINWPTSQATGHQQTTSSRTFNYTLQLYGGSY